MPTRRPKISTSVLCALAAMASTASADPRQSAELDRALQHATPPGPGLDRAQVRGMPWCSNAHDLSPDWAMSVADALESNHRDPSSGSELFGAARALCAAPNDPAARRAAAEIEQRWINLTGMAEPDAFASLSLRADHDTLEAERKALCNAIEPKGGDAQAERHALAVARYDLFGCRTQNPQWLQDPDVDDRISDQLAPLIDRGPAEHDGLAHLAWVLHRQWRELTDGEPDAILGYAIDQFDFHQVSDDAVIHQLDAAPFSGSRYARVLVLESLAHARVVTAKIEAMVAKRVHDATWKELLITAPDRGAAEWRAAVEHDKAALARSDAFALGRGDSHGCEALRGDFLAIVKTLKHDDLDVLQASMSHHPLAGLLLSRLARCMELDADPFQNAAGQKISQWMESIRVTTGPRMAAYFATHEAILKLGEPRPNQWFLSALKPHDADRGTNDRRAQEDPIESVRKAGKTVHVLFPRKRVRVSSQSCRETNKVDKIAPDGKITYRQVCRDTGMVWRDYGRVQVEVPVTFAGGLRPGAHVTFIRIGVTGEDGKDGKDSKDVQLPVSVYKDRTGTHLLAAYGFSLE